MGRHGGTISDVISEFQDCLGALEDLSDLDNAQETLDELDELGGFDEIKEKLSIIDDLGGMQEIKEKLEDYEERISELEEIKAFMGLSLSDIKDQLAKISILEYQVRKLTEPQPKSQVEQFVDEALKP